MARNYYRRLSGIMPAVIIFIYFRMHCPNRRCKRGENCQIHHTFSLKSVASGTFYRNPINLQLCPSLDRDGNVIAHTFPVFNRDKKTYTPAFCLDVDKNYSIEQDQQMLMEHMRKVKDSMEVKCKMLLPKPIQKNKYCNVCKEAYEDYVEHVESSQHKRSIHKSKYNKHIMELCQSFKSRPLHKEDRQETTKDEIIEEDNEPPIRKTRRTESTIESQDSKILAQASSTNISALNRQNSHFYNPYLTSYGMMANMQMPMYYWPGIPGCFPMSFPYPSWGMPEIKYPPFMFPFPQGGCKYPTCSAPIVIPDDE